MTRPYAPIHHEPSYEAALAAFQAIPPIRILFDNGIGTGRPNVPGPGFQRAFSRFPLPGTAARSWYLTARHTLRAARPVRAGTQGFTWRKAARPATDFTGADSAGGLWGDSPQYNWTQNPPGTAAWFMTRPLAHNTVVVGAGALQAWIKAST